jgi:hypothetical protein
MAEQPLIPSGLEVTPQPVEFERSDPIAPGFVTLRGDYENDRGQRFTLTAAALERDADALRSFTGVLQIWLVAVEAGSLADPEQGPGEGPAPAADRPDLERLVREGERSGDEPVLALHVDFRRDGDPDAELAIVGHVDPPIGNGGRHYYSGPDRVTAWGNNATLGGLTRNPQQVALGRANNRDSNYYCWVQGSGPAAGYALDVGWSRV